MKKGRTNPCSQDSHHSSSQGQQSSKDYNHDRIGYSCEGLRGYIRIGKWALEEPGAHSPTHGDSGFPSDPPAA